MIATGNYELIFYNRYGTKLKDLSVEQQSYTEAWLLGIDSIRDSKETEDRLKPTSFTVDRRVYNSLDTKQYEAGPL
jgi:hypothetical protein